MLLPYGTDAPVYHPPIATVGIIAINAVMFFATGMGEGYHGEYDWLILEFDRVNPLQWVTAACMHASWGHLVGNMIFLWCFGLVIEGKLGWRRFSWLYLGLALADGAIGQIPMFLFTDGQGGALGASGVIYALLAISMIWAPQNDIHLFYAWGFWFVGTMEVPIIAVGGFYIALEFLQIAFIGWHMSTPVLHLLGATVGVPFAIYMLQTKRVDCEGWDLFSRLGWNVQLRPKHFNLLWIVGRLAEKRSKDSEPIARLPAQSLPHNAHEASGFKPLFDRPVGRQRDPCADAVSTFSQSVSAGNVDESIVAMNVLKRGAWIPAVPEPSLVRYINLLTKHARHEEVLIPLRFLVIRKSGLANDACLKIANIERMRSDFDAARVALQQMSEPLSDKHARHRAKILRVLDAGVGRSLQQVQPD